MKRTLSVILAILLAVSLCACGNSAAESTSSPEPTATAEATATPKPTAKPTKSASSAESSYSQTESCIECGKPATRTYTNPFSGKVEHYCETDYQRIIDIMSEMESDVGKSEQSKHTCVECGKEGTHKYVSFTGQTEYYCTEHYEKLQEMLKSFGLD